MSPPPGGMLDGRPIIPRPTEEERKAALAHPGPTWTDYFFRSFLKAWIALGYLILDVFVVGFWLENHLYVGILPSLVAAVYLEWLLWAYLYYEPHGGASASQRREPGLDRFLFPVTFGRWTEPGDRVRHGLSPYSREAVEAAGPDPAEFL